jgi:hypothetical protein
MLLLLVSLLIMLCLAAYVELCCVAHRQQLRAGLSVAVCTVPAGVTLSLLAALCVLAAVNTFSRWRDSDATVKA